MSSQAQRNRFVAAHRALRTLAVTGTNGKTTTVSMIEAIVAKSGEPCARITTLGAWVAGQKIGTKGKGSEFLACVETAIDRGVQTLALETTSKALAGGWAQQWPADIAVFTNLSRDHLDMHASPESYFASKAQLFVTVPKGGACILNRDDDNSELLAEVIGDAGGERLYYSSQGGEADLAASAVEASRDGLRVELVSSPVADELGGCLALEILGAVHADNALAAALACHRAGYSGQAIREGLRTFRGVPGRFEVVARRPLCVVDYAHTPDGLRGTLQTARTLVEPAGCLRVVFGCGGERDRGKRAEMGRMAARYADAVIVTNDNPRGEPPAQIASEIEAGLAGSGVSWRRLLNRRNAIAEVIAEAAEGDVVIIAGKGHEDYQEIASERRPFSHADCLRKAMAQRTPAISS